jgi:hypothetical protein
VKFSVLSDPNREYVSRSYQINNFPTHIFIDATGVVRDVQLKPLTVEQAIASAEAAISPG